MSIDFYGVLALGSVLTACIGSLVFTPPHRYFNKPLSIFAAGSLFALYLLILLLAAKQ